MRKKQLKVMVTVILVLSIIISLGTESVIAKTKITKISASKLNSGKQYTMVKMPYNGAYSPLPRKYKGQKLIVKSVQNFCETPDGKYVFAVGEGIIGSGKKEIKNTLLCRCIIPDNRNATAEAECEEAHILYKYGHSDNIAITQPDLEKPLYYIWLVSATNNYTLAAMGNEVVRLTYEVNEEGKAQISQTITLKNFLYTKVAKIKGKLKAQKQGDKVTRVNVTANQNDNLIAFRVQCKNKNVNYVVYDYNELNEKLNQLEGNTIFNMADAKKQQIANVACTFTPSKSFQSMAIDKDYIYMCGGFVKRDTEIYKVSYKAYEKGKVKIQTIKKKENAVKQRIIVYPGFKIKGRNFNKNNAEVQGIMIKKNPYTKKIDYYLVFRAAGMNMRNTVSIYKFTA